jgi:hypothetical protein
MYKKKIVTEAEINLLLVAMIRHEYHCPSAILSTRENSLPTDLPDDG